VCIFLISQSQTAAKPRTETQLRVTTLRPDQERNRAESVQSEESEVAASLLCSAEQSRESWKQALLSLRSFAFPRIYVTNVRYHDTYDTICTYMHAVPTRIQEQGKEEETRKQRPIQPRLLAIAAEFAVFGSPASTRAARPSLRIPQKSQYAYN
jgi:hypothetical protein